MLQQNDVTMTPPYNLLQAKLQENLTMMLQEAYNDVTMLQFFQASLVV